jgi:hypothetical protein
MILYTRVDENGDLVDRALTDITTLARQQGIYSQEFDPNTFQIPAGYEPVTINEPDRSTLTKYQQIEPTSIAKNQAGEWVIDVIVKEVNDQRKNEIDGPMSTEVRNFRNQLLNRSDWTQLPDAPITAEKRAEWTQYRQQLRDITQNPGFPIHHTIPAAPSS